MTVVLALIYIGIVTFGVAFGLTVFQFAILPIANGIMKVKELIDERDRAKPRI